MFPPARSSQEAALHATRPAAREEPLLILVGRKLSFEHENISCRGKAGTVLNPGCQRLTVKPGLVNNLGLGHFRILFADAKPLEHCLSDLEVNCFDVYQLRAVQVASAGGDSIDRLICRAVPLDDALQGGGPKLGRFRRRALRRFKGPERFVCRVPWADRQIEKN